jgi:hypothetical protein
MPVVTLAIWLSLAFCVVASSAAIVYAGLRGWRLWRSFWAGSKRLGDAIGEVAAAAEATERRAVEVTAGTERLLAAAERLQRSLAELQVLRAAAGEPRALLARLRGLVPAK